MNKIKELLALFRGLANAPKWINMLLSGKKSVIFHLAVAAITVFRPEWIQIALEGAAAFQEGVEAAPMSPEFKSLIVFISTVSIVLRKWGVMWGDESAPYAHAVPVPVPADPDGFPGGIFLDPELERRLNEAGENANPVAVDVLTPREPKA